MSSPSSPRGRFEKGRSGNPAGRPPGIVDRRSRGAQAKAEALGIDPFTVLLLLAGDRWAELHPGEPDTDAWPDLNSADAQLLEIRPINQLWRQL